MRFAILPLSRRHHWKENFLRALIAEELIEKQVVGRGAGQSIILTHEVATVGSSIDEDVLEYLGRNADLSIFNQDVMQD